MSASHAPHEKLISSIAVELPEALQWLKRMVEINSFTTNAAGVNRVGEVTAECFAEMGFNAEFIESKNPAHGRHLFLHRNADAGKPVLLVTHLDTVFPQEEEDRHDFHWRESLAEGRIYGPGTVDIKGGTVLIWMMLRALRVHAPRLFEETHWIIAANAAEEVMSADFAVRVREQCPDGARAVLVFEGGQIMGTEYQIVTARKGRAEYRITSEGRAAHAGSSHAEGVNAIVTLCEAVKTAASITDYSEGLTVNVGCISGGTVLNRVPHEAIAGLEVRAYEPSAMQRAHTALRSLAANNPAAQEARLKVECLGTTPAWPASEPTNRAFSFLADAASLLGLRAIATSRGGLSDANYLCGLGPTLDGLGPGGANAHCSERSPDGTKVPEYVDVNSFVPKAAMNVLALCELLAND